MITGGCCTTNPEPVADFFDAFVIGEGEEIIGEIIDVTKKCKKEKLFTSTNKSNVPMQKLMEKLKYKKSGIVHNLDPGDPELFFFKKVTHN